MVLWHFDFAAHRPGFAGILAVGMRVTGLEEDLVLFTFPEIKFRPRFNAVCIFRQIHLIFFVKPNLSICF